MAPRIRNITPDEFRRLFRSPEIQSPGPNTSDLINLVSALEQRQANELKQRQTIAEIERRIAEESAKAQQINALAQQQRGQLEEQLTTQARADIDPTQPGIEEGPLAPDVVSQIEANLNAEEARLRLDPEQFLAGEAQTEKSARDFQEQIALEREKSRLRQEEQTSKAAQLGKRQQEAESKLKKEIFDDARRTAVVLTGAVEKALPLINEDTTGLAAKAKVRSGLAPKSEANQLDKFLDTIKANVGFGKLNAMRAASPTGGALGQVSEREIAFLQASEGSLDQFQRPEELKANLEEINNSYNRALTVIDISRMPGFEELSEQEQRELYELTLQQKGIPLGR